MVVVASAAATSLRLPIDFWLLVKAGVQPEEADVKLCGECIRGVKQKDGTALRQSLAELTARPIAVEFKPLEDELPEDSSARTFLLPGGRIATVGELGFDEGGLGHSVWDSGIAMSIWLASNEERVRGQRVLELGSGLGLSGISAALSGASFVTLSDRAAEPASPWASMADGAGNLAGTSDDGDAGGGGGGKDADVEHRDALTPASDDERTPLRLLENLQANARRCAVGETTSVRALEWLDCAKPDFAPSADETFQVLIGSDLCYYEQVAPALASTICKLLSSEGGVAYLMSPRSKRPGLDTLRRLLDKAGTLEEDEISLVSNYGRTECLLLTFRKDDA